MSPRAFILGIAAVASLAACLSPSTGSLGADAATDDDDATSDAAPDDAVTPDVAAVPDTLEAPDTLQVPDSAAPEADVAFGCEAVTIALLEPTTVEVQTLLHLSTAAPLAGAAYRWTVVQPDGSASVLLPTAHARDVAFEANVVGTYVFTVDVVLPDGTHGLSGCPATPLSVAAVPSAALHVELVWDTPADPDPTDEGPDAGVDLDLHFVAVERATADGNGDGIVDGLFDPVSDTFWFNPVPNLGTLDPAIGDDPSLDRDDTDGAGPENLNVPTPPADARYNVFVHVWSAHDFGVSAATVRIFFHGALAWEGSATLAGSDMWPVAQIDWATATVVPLGGCDGMGALCTTDDACAPETCDPTLWRNYHATLFGRAP